MTHLYKLLHLTFLLDRLIRRKTFRFRFGFRILGQLRLGRIFGFRFRFIVACTNAYGAETNIRTAVAKLDPFKIIAVAVAIGIVLGKLTSTPQKLERSPFPTCCNDISKRKVEIGCESVVMAETAVTITMTLIKKETNHSSKLHGCVLQYPS